MPVNKPPFSDSNPEEFLVSNRSPKSLYTAQLFREQSLGKSLDGKHQGRALMLLGMIAVKEAMIPEIAESWDPGRFTAVKIGDREFTGVERTITYHFDRHGHQFGDILAYTRAANRYWLQHGKAASWDSKRHCMKLPQGRYTRDGKILTFGFDKLKDED